MSGWIGPSPSVVPCGFSARQGLCPLLQEPSSASLLPSNLRETGLPLSGPDRAEDAARRQPASATTRLWSWSASCSSSATRPRSRGWPIPRIFEPPGPADPVKRHRPPAGFCCAGGGQPEATATRLLARQGSPPRGSSDPDAIVTTVARADYERLGSWTLDLPRTAFAEPSDFELRTCQRTGGRSVQPAIGPLVYQCLQSCRDRRCQPCFSGAGAECHDRRAGPASADHRIVFLEAPVASGSSLGADLADRACRSGGPADGSRRQRTGRSSLGRGW